MNDRVTMTGATYSLFRILFGTYLTIHFLHLLPWSSEIFSNEGVLNLFEFSPLIGITPNLLALNDSPIVVKILISLGIISSLFLTLGKYDKPSAFILVVILAWLFQRNPLIANPSLPLVGWMLVFHLFTPGNPFGSLSARGALIDYRWRLDKHLWVSLWVILAFAYTYSGYTKLLSPSWINGEAISLVLNNPLSRDHFLREWLLEINPTFLKLLTWSVLYIELFFAPLSLFSIGRQFAWTAMLLIQIGFLLFLNFADLTFPMLLIHFLTFDPQWLGKKIHNEYTVYYDGHCGLCHGVIKFLVSEDQTEKFQFKALQSSIDVKKISQINEHHHLATFVLKDNENNYFTENTAAIKIMLELGGIWFVIGKLFRALPNSLTKKLYLLIGRNRYLIFSRQPNICPVVPAEVKKRFLA